VKCVTHNKVHALFAENKVHFARAAQLWPVRLTLFAFGFTLYLLADAVCISNVYDLLTDDLELE